MSSIREKLQVFICELTTFKYSHPTIFTKWLNYISEQCTNYKLSVKLIEGDKMLLLLHNGVVDLSLQNYNRALLYKMSNV